MSRRAGQPPGVDWEDAFHHLDSRLRRLQESYNVKEEELKKLKVTLRKGGAAPPPSSVVFRSRDPNTPPPLRSAHPSNKKLHRRGPATGAAMVLSPSGKPRPLSTRGWTRSPLRSRGKGGFTAAVVNWPDRGREGDGRRRPTGEWLSQQEAANETKRFGVYTSDDEEPVAAPWSSFSEGEVSGRAAARRCPGGGGTSRFEEERIEAMTSTTENTTEETAELRGRSLAAPPSDSGYTIEGASGSTAYRGEAGTSAEGRVEPMTPHHATLLPDPAMIWGSEESSAFARSRALYHANQELQRELQESSSKVQGLQQELFATRAAFVSKEAAVSELREEVYRLVQQRDTAVQETENAKIRTTTLEGVLTDRATELSSLRARLVAGADQNELLRQELRKTLEAVQEKTMEVSHLRSQLSVSQSSLTSQRHTNEQLLTELKSQHEQLLAERKRVLQLAREVQSHALDQQHTEDLQDQVQRLQLERSELEGEHLRLMREFVVVSEKAMEEAREAVRADTEEWRRAATHWEDASKRLYKDITSRTAVHQKCREECETAKAARDQLSAELRATREELSLCFAKLDVAWPQHRRVTGHLSKAELETLLRATAAQEALKQEGIALQREEANTEALRSQGLLQVGVPGDKALLPFAAGVDCTAEGRSAVDFATAAEATLAWIQERELPPHPSSGEKNEKPTGDVNGATTASARAFPARQQSALDTFLDGLPPDPITNAERVFELNEANAGLSSELEQLRVSHDLLQQHLQSVAAQKAEQVKEMEAIAEREAVGQALLAQELDRIAFLEKQVHSLRGFEVEPDTNLNALAAGENVLELFLGQLVSYLPRPTGGATLLSSNLSKSSGGGAMAWLTDTMFCTADFLLHETVMTQTIVGLNGFLDTTASYCIQMDALLLYYLSTRELVVQLHRVRDEAEVIRLQEAAVDSAGNSDGEGDPAHRSASHSLDMMELLYETVAEGRAQLLDLVHPQDQLTAQRPQLKGHIHLFRLPSRWSVEDGVMEKWKSAAGPTESGGEHIASVEFSVVARLPFHSEFRALVREALTELPNTGEIDAEAQGPTAKGSSPISTSAGGGVASSPFYSSPPVKTAKTGPMRRNHHPTAIQDWMTRSSRTSRSPHRGSEGRTHEDVDLARESSGGTTTALPPPSGCYGPSHLPLLAYRSAQCSRSAVVPTGGEGGFDGVTDPSSSCLSDEGVQSPPSSSPAWLPCGGSERRYHDLTISRQASVDRQRRRTGEGAAAVRSQLRPAAPPRADGSAAFGGSPFSQGGGIGPGSGDEVYWPQIRATGGPPPSLPSAGAMERPPRQAGVSEGSRFSVEPSPSPACPATTTGMVLDSGLPGPVLQYFSIDIFRVELPADLPPPVPRLSCYYELRALQREVRLTAPPTPRYTVEFQQADGQAGTSFAIHHLGESFALQREPLTLFFLDEDAVEGGHCTTNDAARHAVVWGIAVCELQSVLEHPGVPHAFDLPLLRREGQRVLGGVVRVRLQASGLLTGGTGVPVPAPRCPGGPPGTPHLFSDPSLEAGWDSHRSEGGPSGMQLPSSMWPLSPSGAVGDRSAFHHHQTTGSSLGDASGTLCGGDQGRAFHLSRELGGASPGVPVAVSPCPGVYDWNYQQDHLYVPRYAAAPFSPLELAVQPHAGIGGMDDEAAAGEDGSALPGGGPTTVPSGAPTATPPQAPEARVTGYGELPPPPPPGAGVTGVVSSSPSAPTPAAVSLSPPHLLPNASSGRKGERASATASEPHATTSEAPTTTTTTPGPAGPEGPTWSLPPPDAPHTARGGPPSRPSSAGDAGSGAAASPLSPLPRPNHSPAVGAAYHTHATMEEDMLRIELQRALRR